jgi:hypothetical protein
MGNSKRCVMQGGSEVRVARDAALEVRRGAPRVLQAALRDSGVDLHNGALPARASGSAAGGRSDASARATDDRGSRHRRHRSRSHERRHDHSRSRERRHRSRSRDRKHKSRSRDRKHKSRSRDRKHRSRSRDRKDRNASATPRRSHSRSASRSAAADESSLEVCSAALRLGQSSRAIVRELANSADRRSGLRTLLLMLDEGNCVDVAGVPDAALRSQLEALFRSLALAHDERDGFRKPSRLRSSLVAFFAPELDSPEAASDSEDDVGPMPAGHARARAPGPVAPVEAPAPKSAREEWMLVAPDSLAGIGFGECVRVCVATRQCEKGDPARRGGGGADARGGGGGGGILCRVQRHAPAQEPGRGAARARPRDAQRARARALVGPRVDDRSEWPDEARGRRAVEAASASGAFWRRRPTSARASSRSASANEPCGQKQVRFTHRHDCLEGCRGHWRNVGPRARHCAAPGAPRRARRRGRPPLQGGRRQEPHRGRGRQGHLCARRRLVRGAGGPPGAQ